LDSFQSGVDFFAHVPSFRPCVIRKANLCEQPKNSTFYEAALHSRRNIRQDGLGAELRRRGVLSAQPAQKPVASGPSR